VQRMLIKGTLVDEASLSQQTKILRQGAEANFTPISFSVAFPGIGPTLALLS